MPFSAKISRARFVAGPFSSEQMETIGDLGVARPITERISRGVNANDATAKQLKPGRNGRRGYPDYKIARGLQPIRDWRWTGRLMRSLKVKSANENRCTIGFIDDRSDRVAHANNRIDKMFGLSPEDRKKLNATVLTVLKQARSVVQVKKVA